VLPRVHRFLGGRGVFCVNLAKSTGLAGARLGLIIAAADTIAEIEVGLDPFRLDVFQLASLDTLFTSDGLGVWGQLVDRARAAGARCVALLTELLPCATVGPAMGNVVYCEFAGRCDEHVEPVVAATGATVFPIERRLRVRVGDDTIAALAALAGQGEGPR
jgi:histidinol-phosphate/aromatic aminotransferase/cobyric acid decarboxylase-like protein